jgi:hypothetical protein
VIGGVGPTVRHKAMEAFPCRGFWQREAEHVAIRPCDLLGPKERQHIGDTVGHADRAIAIRHLPAWNGAAVEATVLSATGCADRAGARSPRWRHAMSQLELASAYWLNPYPDGVAVVARHEVEAFSDAQIRSH